MFAIGCKQLLTATKQECDIRGIEIFPTADIPDLRIAGPSFSQDSAIEYIKAELAFHRKNCAAMCLHGYSLLSMQLKGLKQLGWKLGPMILYGPGGGGKSSAALHVTATFGCGPMNEVVKDTRLTIPMLCM